MPDDLELQTNEETHRMFHEVALMHDRFSVICFLIEYNMSLTHVVNILSSLL